MEFSWRHKLRLIPEVRLRNSLLCYPEPIALIEAASFFDIAPPNLPTGCFTLVRNDKKDTAESRFPAPKNKIKNPFKIN